MLPANPRRRVVVFCRKTARSVALDAFRRFCGGGVVVVLWSRHDQVEKSFISAFVTASLTNKLKD